MAKGTLKADELIEKGAVDRGKELLGVYRELISEYEKAIGLAKKANTPKGTNDAVKKKIELDKKQIQAQKELLRLEKEKANKDAARSRADAAENRNKTTAIRLQKEETRQNEQLARAKNKLIGKNSTNISQLKSLNNYYKQQSRYLTELRANYSALALKKEQGEKLTRDEIRELKKLGKQITKLDRQLKKVDASSGRFNRNVGNYGSAFGKAFTALRSFVGVLGIYSGLQVAREVYEQVKAIDAMNKALQQVTETQERYNKEQEFLKDIAEEAGVVIVSLTRSYTKFLAAAKTTNLTQRQTQNIFRQVAKASSILGLSVADTEGVFRALEQMLSKGKVQAEEIRGQLGERLPGAFQILAESMGLTTEELSKQLELGNVYADEVLPKFAEQLEKTYGLDTVDKVDTLAAAQNRLSNAWTAFIQNLENGKGTLSNIFKDTLTAITDVVNTLGDWTQSTEQLNEALYNTLKKGSYDEKVYEINNAFKKQGETLEDIAKKQYPKYIKEVSKAGLEVQILKNEQKRLLEEEEKLNSQTQKSRKAVQTKSRALKANSENQEKNNKLLDEANQYYAHMQGNLDAVKSFLKDATKEVGDLGDETDDLNNTLGDLTPRLQKLSAITFGTTAKEMEALKKQALEMVKLFDGVEINGEVFKFEFGADAIDNIDFSEGLDVLKSQHEQRMDDIVDKTKVSTEQMKSILNGLFSTFSSYYGIDFTAFTNLLDLKEASTEEYADTIGNTLHQLNTFLLNSSLDRYSAEIQANQDALQTVLDNENATEKQKEIAQRKADEKERQLRTEQAKAERRAVLIGIAVDTAAAIVKSLPNIPVSIAVAAIGAAQAAFVASQPLPQYFKGKGISDNYEGLAHLGEKRPEVRIDKDGNISVIKKPTIGYVGKDDLIVPSLSTFNEQIQDSSSDVYQRLSNNVRNDTLQREKMATMSVNNVIDLSSLEGMIQRELRKQAKRPINITNVVKVEPPRRTRF